MRWLALKDLRILSRSPMLVAALVAYPVVVALLIGFALSRGPDRPRVALLNLVPKGQGSLDLGGQRIDATRYASELFRAIQPVRVASREQALDAVRSGRALAALIVPPDLVQQISAGLGRPSVEVAYNIEDPVKARWVEDTINAQLAQANAALSKQLTQVALRSIDLLRRGGRFAIFGETIDVLGLERTRAIVGTALARLPPGSPERPALERVGRFADLAVANLGLAGGLLDSVGRPVQVERTTVSGRRIPLNTFAVAVSLTVSLAFVCVQLAAGLLALEHEDHAFRRLVRGLVPRWRLVAEKIVVAAVCSLGVAVVMFAAVGALVDLDWGRLPAVALGLAGGGVAFAALGVAIGSVTGELRAASLLALALTLPLAFLALVPSGAVAAGLFAVIRVISALFPFKPALRAVDAALDGPASELFLALGHLAALAIGFAAIARLALARAS